MTINTDIAVLFPGQGSQEPNMGRDVAEANADIMALWKKAEKISGIDLRGIYWDGDEAAMADTRNLQPALTLVNLGLWIEASGSLRPSCMAGHSLGEFSALAASEALSVEAVLEAVSLRGRLMADADPNGNGAMAAAMKMKLDAVKAVVADVAESTGEMIRIANYNTPGQFVLSGTKTAIAEAGVKIKEQKGRAIPLKVSGAFHSPLMADAAKELSGYFAKLSWNNPKYPIYCNVTGEPAGTAADLKEIMPKQMTSSVFWIDTITNQYNAGVRQFVEVGPKGVLSKMLGQILKPVADSSEWESLNLGNLEAVEAFKTAK
ncbi:ACP S-malonyltransferase [Halodesulfovibrio sp.]|jgi:[acyl-carrier-protein] S-malonyltransferase|uniref:ACP S-malonyltransferase n=1 Tax=Halodesulfovibrio sp. TaxID=1912772 RepID=UPI0025E1E2A3|nr:ACP S-malonyltransferase [Halodesulfovibrio sp.]MCT4626880.1 ACP S-malonyltransferase [Halodesulfovibrio sp.]